MYHGLFPLLFGPFTFFLQFFLFSFIQIPWRFPFGRFEQSYKNKKVQFLSKNSILMKSCQTQNFEFLRWKSRILFQNSTKIAKIHILIQIQLMDKKVSLTPVCTYSHSSEKLGKTQRDTLMWHILAQQTSVWRAKREMHLPLCGEISRENSHDFREVERL